MKLRIREARIHAGFTQKELADKLGVALTTLSGYETGRSDPKTEDLIPISILCNTTVDFLIGLTDKIEKDPPAPQPAKQKDLVSKEDVENVLVALGITQPGEHLTDADLEFLSGIVSLIRTWFDQKGKQG